jgi:hypothetical protein
MVTLEARPGDFGRQDLYLNGEILLHRYPEGDCDSINWPLRDKDRDNLRATLYGEFECGNLTERTVILPDGTKFDID